MFCFVFSKNILRNDFYSKNVGHNYVQNTWIILWDKTLTYSCPTKALEGKNEIRALYFISIVTKIERDNYNFIVLVGSGYVNFDGINGHKRSKDNLSKASKTLKILKCSEAFVLFCYRNFSKQWETPVQAITIKKHLIIILNM